MNKNKTDTLRAMNCITCIVKCVIKRLKCTPMGNVVCFSKLMLQCPQKIVNVVEPVLCWTSLEMPQNDIFPHDQAKIQQMLQRQGYCWLENLRGHFAENAQLHVQSLSPISLQNEEAILKIKGQFCPWPLPKLPLQRTSKVV